MSLAEDKAHRWQIDDDRGVLVVRVFGHVGARAASQLGDDIARAAKQAGGAVGVLYFADEVQGFSPSAPIQHAHALLNVARRVAVVTQRPLIRTAVVAAAPILGGKLKAFEDESEARKWLAA